MGGFTFPEGCQEKRERGAGLSLSGGGAEDFSPDSEWDM